MGNNQFPLRRLNSLPDKEREMYIVGFNGPPECGKDTLAEMVKDHMIQQGVKLPIEIAPLSWPLRVMAYSMVDGAGEQIEGRSITGPDYEAFKNQYFHAFDRTGRQLMIDISESFLKPVYGQSIMANLLIERYGDFKGILLVPDCGFQNELETLARLIGNHKIYLASVLRAGCDFTNDSRSYVTHHFMQIIDNNGSLDDLRTEVGRIYGRLVNQMGWTF